MFSHWVRSWMPCRPSRRFRKPTRKLSAQIRADVVHLGRVEQRVAQALQRPGLRVVAGVLPHLNAHDLAADAPADPGQLPRAFNISSLNRVLRFRLEAAQQCVGHAHPERH